MGARAFLRGFLYGYMYPWRVARAWYLERFRGFHEYVDCPRSGCDRCLRW